MEPKFIRVVFGSLLIIVLFHVIIKNLLNEQLWSPWNKNESMKNMKMKKKLKMKMNEEPEETEENNNETNETNETEDDVDELREYINKTHGMDLSKTPAGYNYWEDNKNVADFPNDNTNLNLFFETDKTRPQFAEPAQPPPPKLQPNQMEREPDPMNGGRAYRPDQWVYQDENVMNGGSPFFDRVMAFDNIDDNENMTYVSF
jgi:FtsZ-interacting cell division protein ZipA